MTNPTVTFLSAPLVSSSWIAATTVLAVLTAILSACFFLALRHVVNFSHKVDRGDLNETTGPGSVARNRTDRTDEGTPSNQDDDYDSIPEENADVRGE